MKTQMYPKPMELIAAAPKTFMRPFLVNTKLRGNNRVKMKATASALSIQRYVLQCPTIATLVEMIASKAHNNVNATVAWGFKTSWVLGVADSTLASILSELTGTRHSSTIGKLEANV